MQDVVERVIYYMWDNYANPVTLAELADVAILSQFHFSRVFRDHTGTSPGRFLSAIRLFEAKRLLVTTTCNVTDIAFGVGYSSLGTFTRRFTQSVGVSPARYRRMAESHEPDFPFPTPDLSRPCATVSGDVTLSEPDLPLRVYLGTFESAIVQGLPTACDIVDCYGGGGTFRLGYVPEGEWYIQAVGTTAHTYPQPWIGRCAYVGTAGPAKVRGGDEVEIELRMRPRRLSDLPILLMLPDIDEQARPHADLLTSSFA